MTAALWQLLPCATRQRQNRQCIDKELARPKAPTSEQRHRPVPDALAWLARSCADAAGTGQERAGRTLLLLSQSRLCAAARAQPWD
eukprot:9028060-Pyramimonas_sp.AAC.1